MISKIILLLLICYGEVQINNALVTDKEYALMPELFYLDNYDNCMLLGDEAQYCTFTFELEPLDFKNKSHIWNVIEEVSSSPKNYRHDLLRHGICVPFSCRNVPKGLSENSTILRDELNNCYNAKYVHQGLKGNIRELKCETTISKYKIDTFDKAVAVIFVLYILLLIFASLYEGIARYKSDEEYEKITSTKCGRIITAFSIPKNWYRLKRVKESPDTEKLRCIQGIRLYNMMIVTLSHSVLVVLISPISNPKYVETITEKFLNIFLSSGGLCVSTFFCISTWLLTYNFFVLFEGKRDISFTYLLVAFINRYIRLTPVVAVIVIFHSTWLVHLFNGPNWDNIIGTEYRNCRKNWWTNLLYLNNYVDSENMCLQTSWYLAVDNVYFGVALIAIWFMKKYEKKIPLFLASLLFVTVLVSFTINYVNDFEGAVIPRPEKLYMFRMFEGKQLQTQLSSIFMNTGGLVIGFLFGYLHYKCKDMQLFTNKMSVAAWWIISFSCPLGIIIIPGLLIFDETNEHSRFWASVLVAVNRPIYAFGIALAIFGMSQGIGWLAKFTCEWSPTYILGRITYCAYLVQVALVKITPGLRRFPVYANDFTMISQTLSDISLSLITGAILTLTLELPMTELQKIFIAPGGTKKENQKKKIK